MKTNYYISYILLLKYNEILLSVISAGGRAVKALHSRDFIFSFLRDVVNCNVQGLAGSNPALRIFFSFSNINFC